MNDILLFILVKAKYISVFLTIISAAASFVSAVCILDTEGQTGAYYIANRRVMYIAFICFLFFGALAIGLPTEEESKTYLQQK